jgi:leucyl-tRNA synthetase
MLKITAYADRLLSDLDKLDWPEKVKKMQTDWIGKSYGAEVDFAVDGMDESITVYTTRPDTLYGATFMVLAPEHALAAKLATDETREAVEKYIYDASMKSNVDRMQDKEKTGVFTGSYAINPLNGAKTPIWLSDYVLADYGTGAIMCVPAHDDRDFAFAKKFDLPIIQVIAEDGKEIPDMTEAYTEAKGTMINSGEWNGRESAELKREAPEMIEKLGYGKKTVNYKLRDWVFSRQRYWGEPIPIVHCPDCGAVAVPEDQLPVLLPDVEKYEPTGTGESPLAAIDSWVNTTCPKCGKPAKRETNTMPQWAGSSWYFLRYVDSKNDKALVDKEKAHKYLPVDMYIGGVEHAVLHLLYSRFYTKFLYDIGVVDFEEPFTKLFNQGMICGRDKDTGAATKMSKSLGNIVSPDDMVRDYGCDALRLYELFIGPPELDSIWDDRGIDGVYRFLARFYTMVTNNIEKNVPETEELVKLRHKLTHVITTRLESFSFNTVISGFMEYNNKFVELTKTTGVDRETLKTMVRLIAPFAPHVGEELWEQLGGTESVFAAGWPEYDDEKINDNVITIPVQINGKTKGTIDIAADEAKDAVLAKGKEAIADKLAGLNIIKEIYVPGKIVNIVAK